MGVPARGGMTHVVHPRGSRQLSAFRMAHLHADHRGFCAHLLGWGPGGRAAVSSADSFPSSPALSCSTPRKATPRCGSVPAGVGGLAP
jgi:hypothetical protein